ncbi:MAG TPA: heavy metal translocating P-type ATPase [Candidatus Saccharimonadales bacterium]|nr:heavy metal translocating P-type ATPase [Candidatus Saccharimonadales bacterium]
MKRLISFVRSYKLFAFALAGLAAAGILTFFKLATLAHWVLGVVSLIAVIPLATRMINDLRHGRYGVDILAATAIVTSVLMHQYWAAIIVVIMLSGGESLEAFAAARAHSELRELLKRQPQVAHILRRHKVVDVPAHEVAVHDKIIIKPGEVVPVDAIILEGTGSFDEASLTGESLPVVKQIDDEILSGAINLDGSITAKAIHAAKDSQYQQIVRLVRAAAENPAPFVRLADRYSIPFTIAAYTIAGLAWILSHQAIRFLEVIIVATPCPLILAVPIALIAGMSRAARDGIIIKTGTALEQLATAKTFAFDKTGTLTRGMPEVDTIVAFGTHSEQDVLSAAACLEQHSTHVLAKAIVEAAKEHKCPPSKAKHVKEIAGSGLEAHINGKDILVGRLSLMVERDVSLPSAFKPARIAQTATLVAIDGQLAGYITFADALRSDTKQTLKQLAALGVTRTLMVTGDNRAVAKAIARSLGITDIKAEALPADKLLAIEGIAEKPVAFVGDGINDAPVLTASDVGIALGARGSTAASESADIVIMQDSFSHVALAVATAKRAFHIATQSVLIGIILSVVLMLVFATGKFPPVAGAIIQEVVDVVVIFNALRAHSGVKLPDVAGKAKAAKA